MSTGSTGKACPELDSGALDGFPPFGRDRGKVGALNLIDLANFHSCAFLSTQDLGKVHADGKLEILGRMDNSDIRGCNLMVSG